MSRKELDNKKEDVILPIIRTIWRTQKDRRSAQFAALEGHSWTLDIGDPYPKQLIHPVYGPVYDMRPAAKCSLVKEEEGHLCGCTLEHQVRSVSTVLEDDTGNTKITSQTAK